MERRDFFISYTRSNAADADWIAETLIQHGYTVYIQTRDIAPGENFVQKMEEFMENSDGFIAVWSRGYHSSPFAMDELRAAYNAQQHGQMKQLLPVCVEEYPLPWLYAARVHADLYGVDEAEKERKLLSAVGYRGIVSPPSPKPEPEPVDDTPDAATLYELGCDYFYGRGVTQDYHKARAYYEQAAEKGNANALSQLGYLYHFGLGVPVDYNKALAYYEQAAEKGIGAAFHNMGWMYEYAKGVKQDYDRAMELYQQAIDRGDNSAANGIARVREKMKNAT